MEVLFEAEQIAKTLEECRAEIATLNEKLKLEQALKSSLVEDLGHHYR